MVFSSPSSRTIGPRAFASLLGDVSAADGPAYVALAERVRLLLEDGRLAPETRLPAERELADLLGRSRTTISAAYRRLREQGQATSVQGSGTVVHLSGRTPVEQPVEGEGVVDLGKAILPPWPGLADTVRSALGSLEMGDYGQGFDLVGRPELRARIAARYTARGLPTSPEQILVTLGAQHALALIARTFLTRGDVALVEAPTYPHAVETLRSAGARLVGSAVSARGWDLDQFSDVLARTRPALAYLMPDFQNPTGASMSATERRAVVDAALRSGTMLLIDETTAELGIDVPGSPVPLAALAQGSASERSAVLTVGSVGKTVWYGLRIGWIRAEEHHIRRLASGRPAGDMGTPLLEQLVTSAVLDRMPEVLAHRATSLRTARDTLIGMLGERLPEWQVPNVPGGISLWVGLGAPVSTALAIAARPLGLQITPGPRFGLDGAFERFLRIPFARDEPAMDRAVDVLAEVWPSIRARSTSSRDEADAQMA